MRPPSIRLTNRGNGPETIAVYAVRWTKDTEANPIKQPYGTPSVFPATVTRQDAVLTESNGSTDSVTAYKVMVHSPTDPGITTETTMTWTVPIGTSGAGGPPITHELVAAGPATNMGPGAWVVSAMEVMPDPDQPDGPWNLQQS